MPVVAPERHRSSQPDTPVIWPPRRRPHTLRTLAVIVTVPVLLLGAGRLLDVLPSLRNPFSSQTVDRTQPAVLRALEDLTRYHAATGHFQVIVDLEEDARFLPDFVRGERTLFVAGGKVDASVDFSGLGTGSVTVAPDGKRVTVALPRARLADAAIDPAASRVVSRDRGLLDRLGSVFSDSPTGERQLYLLAEKKLEAAARGGGVVERAEQNTRAMLEALLRSLGFESVTVTFS